MFLVANHGFGRLETSATEVRANVGSAQKMTTPDADSLRGRRLRRGINRFDVLGWILVLASCPLLFEVVRVNSRAEISTGYSGEYRVIDGRRVGVLFKVYILRDGRFVQQQYVDAVNFAGRIAMLLLILLAISNWIRLKL